MIYIREMRDGTSTGVGTWWWTGSSWTGGAGSHAPRRWGLTELGRRSEQVWYSKQPASQPAGSIRTAAATKAAEFTRPF